MVTITSARSVALAIAALALLASACGGTGAASPSVTAAQSTSPADSPAAATPTAAASPAVVDAGAAGAVVTELVDRPVPEPPASTVWIRVVDPAAPFSFEVPSTWDERQAFPWLEDGSTVGTLLAAGPSIAAIGADFSRPGTAIGVSANPSGSTARAVVEADDYTALCAGGPIEEAAEAGFRAAARMWTGCGGTAGGFILVVAIEAVPGPGMIVAILQGAADADLGFLERILSSIAAESIAAPSAPPATPLPSAASTQAFSVVIDECLYQMSDAFAIGRIRNDDDRPHAYVVYVRFVDTTGVVVGEAHQETTSLAPGETYRYQTPHMLAQGIRGVTCTVVNVEAFG